jgi:REP-associated tyrosine transposase
VGILANHQSPSVVTNSVKDHMHILLALSKNYSVAKIVEEVKTDSSGWMRARVFVAFDGRMAMGLSRLGNRR